MHHTTLDALALDATAHQQQPMDATTTCCPNRHWTLVSLERARAQTTAKPFRTSTSILWACRIERWPGKLRTAEPVIVPGAFRSLESTTSDGALIDHVSLFFTGLGFNPRSGKPSADDLPPGATAAASDRQARLRCRCGNTRGRTSLCFACRLHHFLTCSTGLTFLFPSSCDLGRATCR